MNLIIDVKSINPYNNCNLRKIIFFQYLPISIGLVDQMGARFDRLRYEVFQNLFLSPMNTGSVRPAVATTPTACGIETCCTCSNTELTNVVATTPTACGIETYNLLCFLFVLQPMCCNNTYRLRY